MNQHFSRTKKNIELKNFKNSQKYKKFTKISFFLDMAEAKKCVKWICNYIEYQANKAAPLHVRDLHSVIVAAFNCLAQWVLCHHWLLDDAVSLEIALISINGAMVFLP